MVKSKRKTATISEDMDISLSQFQGKKHILLEFYIADFGAT